MGHPLFDLKGKTAVVVGGTSGIGLAMAVGLAEAGADVVASSRRAEQVEEAAKAIEAKGRRSLRLTSDVGDRASLRGAAGWDGEGVWEGRYSDQLGGEDQAGAYVDGAGRDVGRHYEYECHRDAAGLPDLREAHAGARVWADHQYRFVEYVCFAEGSDGVCGE